MKNKGFTLIELLAVIVILAIIAFIAIPVITNMVENSRKGAAESSALGYIDAVEKYVMMSDLNSTKYNYNLKGKTLNVTKETDSIPALNTFVNVNGKKPVGTDDYVKVSLKGKVEAESGNVAELTINGYKVVCESSSKCKATTKVGKANNISANEVGVNYGGTDTSLNLALDDLYNKLGD